MQCLAVYLTPTKQELQPNFQMHFSSASVCALLQLQSRLCNVSVSRSCLLGVLHHHCTWLPTCVLHYGCMGLFLFHVRTLPSWFFAVLPLRQASPSEHLRLSPFPISTDPNLDFFFSCRRWSSTRWMVSRSRATWYTTSLNSMWVALPKNVLSLSGISSRPRSQCGYTLSLTRVFFLDIGNFVGSVKINIHL